MNGPFQGYNRTVPPSGVGWILESAKCGHTRVIVILYSVRGDIGMEYHHKGFRENQPSFDVGDSGPRLDETAIATKVMRW